ncbi:MAG: alpha/beta fold hydrolase [Planctomycetota bacterium]|jgi:pimeloyl-ACP methyl ester carboxylesterase
MIVIQTSLGQVAVKVLGEGEPVLLIPGFPLDHRMWEPQLGTLARSFQVIAPDLRGFGASSQLDGPVSMRAFAEDLVEVLDHVAPDKQFHVCGLSMGGYIAWQLIRHWPDRVARLVLCHTRSAPDSPETARGRRLAMEGIRHSGPAPFLQAMLERVLGSTTRADQPELVARVREWMAEAPPESLIQTLDALATRPDATPWLESLACPTLVVAGAEDPITPAEEMREMAARISGSRFEVLEKVGHLSPCEAPETLTALLLEFLQA